MRGWLRRQTPDGTGMIRRAVIVLTVAAAWWLLTAAADADAATLTAPAIDLCPLGEPTIENPLHNGVLSSALPRPTTIPKHGDPWNPADQTTILEQYGTAGAAWSMYDNGCTPGAGLSPGWWTGLANFLTLGPRFFTALAASVANWVLSPQSWLPALDAPTDAVAAGLADNFAGPLMPIALAVAAIGIVWAARRARFSHTMTAVMFIVIGVAFLGVAANGPSKLAGALDGVVAGTVAEVMGADADTNDASIGAAVIAPMWEVVAYDRWLEGNFGSATSDLAVKYGPALFKAQALTWSEAAAVEGDTAKRKALYDRKKAEWKRVAAEIKAADETVTYQFLTGNRGQDRAGVAVISLVVAAVVLPFIIVALGMVLAGYIVLRLGAAMLPVFAVAVVVFRGVGRTLAQIVGAVLVNTVVFAAGASAVIAISGTVLKSDLPAPLSIIVVAVMSFICWMILRPFRTLTRMASNPGSVAAALEAPRDAVNAVKGFAAKAAASYVGNELADNDDAGKGNADPVAAETAAHANRPELHYAEPARTVPTSAEPTPAPVVVTAPAASAPAAPAGAQFQDPDRQDRTWRREVDTPAPAPATQPAAPMPDTTPGPAAPAPTESDVPAAASYDEPAAYQPTVGQRTIYDPTTKQTVPYDPPAAADESTRPEHAAARTTEETG